MQFSLSEVASALGLPAPSPDAAVTGWSIDTRTLAAGDLFFAFPGTRVEGSSYIGEAFAKGAVAAIASAPAPQVSGPVLVVPDVAAALGQLGSWARTRWGGTVVGLTGSGGKTTTKEAIVRVLSTAFSVASNKGNLNNHLGLPLSILRIPDGSQVAVLEMGMNHAGEIRYLAETARPDIGVITNVGYAHIENFDSIEGIAAAKRELIEGLSPEGTAVLNADDERVRKFREVHPGAVITYGITEDADIRATGVQFRPDGTDFQVDNVVFHTALPGIHGLRNTLAALAAGRVMGIPLARLVDAAAGLQPLDMRGARRVWNGITILDDTYNANPDACIAMLDLLAVEPASRRIAVLGEMRELGKWSEELHRRVGRHAAKTGLHTLVGITGAARYTVEEAILAGLPAAHAQFFPTPADAGDFLRRLVQPGDAILFKGSRGTRVEQALERLVS